MMTSAVTPHSSPRGIRLRNASAAISAAWAKLDHAVKAIRLRFADGSRAASSFVHVLESRGQSHHWLGTALSS
jgi:hypothetical protein